MIEFCNTALAYDTYGGFSSSRSLPSSLYSSSSSSSSPSSAVLSAIHCTFERHGFTCVIGKNGSGKSTLLRAAAGLAPYSGSLRLEGDEICRIPLQTRAKKIAYLPQTRPIPTMDVGMLIAHGRYPHLGFSKTLTAADKKQIAYAASVTGVAGLLNRRLSDLSGGERQRAYIAMMVAQDADMMLLDEPTTHLDIAYQLEVMALLTKLHQHGKGIVMAAHDLPQAFHYATHVLLLADGGVAASGTPDALCQNPVMSSAFGVSITKTEDRKDLYAYRITKGVIKGVTQGVTKDISHGISKDTSKDTSKDISKVVAVGKNMNDRGDSEWM